MKHPLNQEVGRCDFGIARQEAAEAVYEDFCYVVPVQEACAEVVEAAK